MLKDYLTAFVCLNSEEEKDGLGGVKRTWQAGEMFLGEVTTPETTLHMDEGLPVMRTGTVLVHLPGIALHLGQRVMRVHDGAVYRVCGNSDDMTTPRFARTACCQVPVERLVYGA